MIIYKKSISLGNFPFLIKSNKAKLFEYGSEISRRRFYEDMINRWHFKRKVVELLGKFFMSDSSYFKSRGVLDMMQIEARNYHFHQYNEH